MQQINVKQIIIEKGFKKATLLPSWLIRAVERLIKLDKINDVLAKYSDQDPINFIDSTLKYIGVDYTVHGIENIPTNKRIIFASNHPLGGLDGMALVKTLNEHSPNGVKVIVNDILMFLEPLKSIFIPINKHGQQNSANLNFYNSAFESNLSIITFPAGLCSRLIDGQIKDPQWRGSFIQKAIATNRIIVPIFFDGTNSRAFYRFARLRKWLKIKANLEMICLPREMFKQNAKHLNIYIGKPIEIDNSKSVAQWTQIARDASYQMKPLKQKTTT